MLNRWDGKCSSKGQSVQLVVTLQLKGRCLHCMKLIVVVAVVLVNNVSVSVTSHISKKNKARDGYRFTETQ